MIRPFRPNVLFIPACLTAIIILDILDNGDTQVALVAAGALAGVLNEIVRKDD